MVILVTGGSGSGKSAYAESRIETFTNGQKKYYLATMQIYDEEGKRKVERHRRMREGKGFETIEQPVAIGDAAAKIEKGAVVLLECISNLTANEMFAPNPVSTSDTVEERIIRGIVRIMERADTLLIVTNNVFEDGCVYDSSVTEYIRVLGRINRRLAVLAGQVIEVSANCLTLNRACAERDAEWKRKRGKGMEFYFGGRCQGKLDYVRKLHAGEVCTVVEGSVLSLVEEECRQQLDREESVILNHLQDWVLRCMKTGADPEQKAVFLWGHYPKLIVICDEIGNGIVPMDEFEREYRECVGRIQCNLADRAEKVGRILCGMGQKLK